MFGQNLWGHMLPQVMPRFITSPIILDQQTQVASFFMEIIIIMSWSIWTVKNNPIFTGEEGNTQKYKSVFKNAFGQLFYRRRKNISLQLVYG